MATRCWRSSRFPSGIRAARPMIVFIDENRAYIYWVTHHRQGFVLDGRRKPKISHLVLHRADCSSVKSAPSKQAHWTTAGNLKACSLNRDELQNWAVEETTAAAELCAACKPGDDTLPADPGEVHLTKLGNEMLEYILEATLIHLEHEHPPYRLTVSDIAACFAKTPGQVSHVLHQLLDAGFITVPGRQGASSPIPPKRIVLPTIQALRTLEAFQSETDNALQQELGKLHME
jgi:hypothetical protein